MTDFDEILGAFEQALELERELGTRTVECDRALLLPLRPAPAAALAPVQPAAPAPRAEMPVAAVPKPAPAPVPPPVRPSMTRPGARSTTGGKVVDLAFIVAKRPTGAAAELLAKMVAAIGYTMETVTVSEAAAAANARPAARIYVVLGSDAFKIFVPGQRAALGLWTNVGEIPTVVTYSPARILTFYANDAVQLTNAKRQIWSDLKSALAHLGKKPPSRSAKS